MKKLTFRVAALLLAAFMFTACFTACGSTKSDLVFKNSLSSTILEVYVSPTESETWDEDNLVNLIDVKSGGVVRFDFSKFGGESGKVYDIGTIDDNNINYDGYEIVLTTGDTITLSGNSEAAVFTVTHADGTTTDYNAMVFPNS